MPLSTAVPLALAPSKNCGYATGAMYLNTVESHDFYLDTFFNPTWSSFHFSPPQPTKELPRLSQLELKTSNDERFDGPIPPDPLHTIAPPRRCTREAVTPRAQRPAVSKNGDEQLWDRILSDLALHMPAQRSKTSEHEGRTWDRAADFALILPSLPLYTPSPRHDNPWALGDTVKPRDVRRFDPFGIDDDDDDDDDDSNKENEAPSGCYRSERSRTQGHPTRRVAPAQILQARPGPGPVHSHVSDDGVHALSELLDTMLSMYPSKSNKGGGMVRLRARAPEPLHIAPPSAADKPAVILVGEELDRPVYPLAFLAKRPSHLSPITPRRQKLLDILARNAPAKKDTVAVV